MLTVGYSFSVTYPEPLTNLTKRICYVQAEFCDVLEQTTRASCAASTDRARGGTT